MRKGIAGVLIAACAAGGFSVCGAAQQVDRAITPLHLAELKDIGGHARGALSVSPDGRWVAFQLQVPLLEENTFRLTWFAIATTDDGAPRSMGDGGGLLLNPARRHSTNGNRPEAHAVWMRDSTSFVYLKHANGEVQIWRSWIDTGEQRQLTHNPSDVMDVSLSADGAQLIYSVARPRGTLERELEREGLRGYLFDDRFRAYSERYPTRHWCGSGWADAVSLARDCEPQIWTYSLADGRERPLSREERLSLPSINPLTALRDTRKFRSPVSSRSGGRVAWLQADDPRAEDAYRPALRIFAGVSPENGVACKASACVGDHLQLLSWSENERAVYFLRIGEDNVHRIYEWKPSTGAVRRIVEVEGALQDCEIGRREAICLREQPTVPREIVTVDLHTGTTETLYNPNPQVAGLTFSRMRKLLRKDDLGNLVSGWLVYPHGYVAGRRYPVVVMPYSSSGFLRGDVGDEYPIHVFAANGLMALSMTAPETEDYARLSPSRIQVALEKGNKRRRAHLAALRSMLNQLDEEGLIDPARVGLTGLSDAAQQVHFAVINSRLIAAASVSSIVTPDYWYHMEAPHVRSHLRQWWGGAPSYDLENYRSLSYRANVDRINAALLANVSDHEFLLALQDFAALQDAGIPVEMHVFPNEHHVKWQPQHRLSIYRRNLQWFQFWLQGVEVADPVDPGQYARWRKLREQHDMLRQTRQQ